MSDHPLNHTPLPPSATAALTQEQQDYEAMYGVQPEWHIDVASLTSGAASPEDNEDDDAIYRRLFGPDNH